MSLIRSIALLAAAGLSLVAGPAAADETVQGDSDLKKLGEKHNCVVYKGDKGDTGISKVVAKCEWDVPAEKMIKAVSSADMHDDWLSAVTESTPLGDDRYKQVHQASGIADRQIVLKFTHEKRSDGGFRTSWTRDPTQEALGEGRIQTNVDDGYWDVTPNGEGKSKVEYGLLYDPAGKVPKWIVNGFQKGGTMDTLEQMRDAALKQ